MSDNIYEKRVKDVMSGDVVTIDAGESVHDALQVMAENKVGALPVIDRHDRCVGIISTSDFVEITRDLEAGLNELEQTDELLFGHVIETIGDGIGHQSVMDVMSENVVSTHQDSLLSEAAGQLLQQRIHRMPVLDDKQRLVGIVSATDILSAFVKCAKAAV
jgi:CBS domain-containing protein